MYEIYELNSIQNILKCFKVNTILIVGNLKSNLSNELNDYDADIIVISNEDYPNDLNRIEIIEGNPIETLYDFNNYDAIFLNDDPNWYTTFNELNIIKNSNDEFPLVIICNNKFPYKHRDCYKNPNYIPKNFLNEYSKNLPIEIGEDKIIISDKCYYAKEDNTSKNGVLTAIEDFLNKNNDIGMKNLNLMEEITILYPKTTISKIRIDKFFKEINDKKILNYNFYDDIYENQLLFSYIKEYAISEEDLNIIDDLKNELSDKNKKIKKYENEIEIHNSEMIYKNSVIKNVEKKFDLKNSKIKNIESKLMNKETEINKLQNNLNKANNQIKSLKKELNKHEYILNIKENEMKEIYDLKELEIKRELEHIKDSLNYIKEKNSLQKGQISMKEYRIHCFEEEIENKYLEIQYLEKNSLIKKIFNPLGYFYLILKFPLNEWILNIKLYNLLKSGKYFDIGYYLNNYKDLENSKWIKYFSPELHYICYGFKENRKFNKKYLNKSSKKNLLKYLITQE